MRVCPKWKLDSVTLTALAFLLAVMHSLAASGDELWDSSFGMPGANGPVTAVATDGKVVFIGGYFSEVAGVMATNIATWDGTKWSALGGGVGVYDTNFYLATEVNSIVLSGSQVFVGGMFTNAGAVAVKNIARWDGTNWSALGNGLDNIVFDLATKDGVLYAGGHFGFAGGTPANRIAKWNGTAWSALGDGVTNTVDLAFVHAIAISGNDVYVGGRFTRAGNVPANNVAKWDGTNWVALGSGLAGEPVYALTTKGNEVYAGGGFTMAGAISVKNIAKWDGVVWNAVGAGVTGARGAYPYVTALIFNGDNLFIGGGDIREVGGVSTTNIARWDGISWSALGGGVSRGLNDSSVHALATTGSELIVGGFFDAAGANPSTNITLWHIPHALTVSQTGNQLSLSWPATGTNFVLETKDSFPGTNWSEVSQPPALHNNECVVTQTVSGASQFYRLRRK